jgi:signal transduction histidine kinase
VGLERALRRLMPPGKAWQDFREAKPVLDLALQGALSLAGFRHGLALIEEAGELRLTCFQGLRDAEIGTLLRQGVNLKENARELQALLAGTSSRAGLDALPSLGACFPAHLGFFISLPLFDKGKLKGLLLLASSSAMGDAERRNFRNLAPVLSALAAGTLRSVDLFQRLVERTRELERTVADLGRAQRRSELVKHAAAVAHQIRNPLSVVSAHVDLMREQAESAGGQVETLDLLAKKVGEANATVQQLLELSRPLSLQVKAMELGPLLKSFVGFIQPKCRLQGVELAVSVEDGLPAVWAEDNALQRCLLDLTLNSLQMLGASGRLEISARRRKGGVALAVSDDGPGITDAMLPLLFEPFSSGRAGGTGMGLYNVRRICREMGAGVLAGRLDKGGSRFCLYLRVTSSEKPAPGGETSHEPD